MDNRENADLITQTLLHEGLAACIQSSNIESAYRWKGKIITSKEIRLEIKTKVSLFESLKETIERLHTYDVPEIVMVTITDANRDYLHWIEKETRQTEYIESVSEALLQNI